MKKIIGLFLIGLLLNACGQRFVSKGDAEYKDMAYKKAAASYEKAISLKDKPERHIKAAQAYDRMNQSQKAEEHYNKAFLTQTIKDPQYKYDYAQVLMKNGKKKEAANMMKEYLADRPQDSLAKEWLTKKAEDGEYAIFTPSRIKVEMIPLVNYTAAFGAYPNADGVYFVGEQTAEKGSKVNPWNGQAFLDVFYVKSIDKTEWAAPEKAKGDINNFLHDGPLCFDASGEIAYLTQSAISDNKQHKLDGEKVNQLKIVRLAKQSNQEWKRIDELPFNTPNASSMHPTISKKGNVLIFASDRDGGFGGNDLYLTKYDGQTWSNPINLGAEINTSGEEVFPFMMHEDTLFFSSTGHGGMGGLDVFISFFDGKKWSHPKNLLAPINTNYDDFSFYRQSNGMSGYFSSNRNGKDDIYTWQVADPEFLLVGVVTDIDKDPVADAKVVLKEGGIVVDSVKTGKKGDFEMPLDWNKDYTVSGTYKTQKTDTANASTQGKTESEVLNVELQLEGPEFLVKGIAIDLHSKARLKDVKVELLDKNEKVLNSMVSNEKGEFMFKLERNVEYGIYGIRKNNFTRKVQVSTMGYKESKTFEVVLELEEVIAEKPIVLNDIYYDFDKYEIRKDAVGDLDNLVHFMNKNTAAKIELSSHTDCRGSDSYNQKLSNNRALSAMNYLIEKGIAKDRIIDKGYGETQLRNQCKDGVKCTEEEHQENRRTEFKVLK